MGIDIHKVMAKHESYSWSCMTCDLPNFNTTFFDWSVSFLDSSNSFGDLEIQVPQSPLISTPSKKLSEQFRKKQIPGKLKILKMNLQSIINKVPLEFHCLVDVEKPNIMVGTESWLSSVICNSEIFPPGYLAFRADCESKTVCSGGVFVVSSFLHMTT